MQFWFTNPCGKRFRLCRDICESRQSHASNAPIFETFWSKALILVLNVNPKNWCNSCCWTAAKLCDLNLDLSSCWITFWMRGKFRAFRQPTMVQTLGFYWLFIRCKICHYHNHWSLLQSWNGCDQGRRLDFIWPFPVTTVAKLDFFTWLVT